jgi:hypothetical protein
MARAGRGVAIKQIPPSPLDDLAFSPNALSRFRGLPYPRMTFKGRDALTETSMICPHGHAECDNRGCRYGGCQGRPSGGLVAHKDPCFRRNAAVERQNGGNVSAPITHPPSVTGSSARGVSHNWGLSEQLPNPTLREHGSPVPAGDHILASTLD